jgi:hypothetical protein
MPFSKLISRKDDELLKHSFSPGDYTKVTREDGTAIRVIGDIKYSVSDIDYFAYCLSSEWDPALYDDFGVDCCAVIKDSEEFARRLEAASIGQLDGWRFHHGPVNYFDPYEPSVNDISTMRRQRTFALHTKKNIDFYGLRYTHSVRKASNRRSWVRWAIS